MAFAMNTSEKRKTKSQPSTSHSLVPGSLCWSQLDGHPWWPAMFIGGRESGCPDCGAGKTWVYWFGENRISKVKVDKICPFADNFLAKWTKRTSKVYNKAVLECCKMHAKTMLHDIDRWEDERCLKWAEEGFHQQALQGERECTWPKGIPPSIQKVVDEINEREAERLRKDSLRKSKFGGSTKSLCLEESRGLPHKRKIGGSTKSLCSEESRRLPHKRKFGGSTKSLCSGGLGESIGLVFPEGLRRLSRKFGGSTKSLCSEDFGASTSSAFPDGSRRVYGNLKRAASSNDLSVVTKPCVVGLTRCDEILRHQRVTLLSFNEDISPVLLPKLGFNVTRRLIVNRDVDALPERAKLLELGPIDIFIGGASRQETQADSLCRNLFECYRIVTVLQESKNDLQWVFYAPLDVSQVFKETANRFFACKGVMLKNRIGKEQFLLWNNMRSLGKLTTGMKI